MNADNSKTQQSETEAEQQENKELDEFMCKGANKNVAMVPQETSLRTVVELMVAKKISSVLIHDANEEITGIITEKDIVQKLTLLEFDNKLEKNVLTLATRPVIFVNQQTYQEEIIKLHLDKRIHHFPVVNSPTPKTENVVTVVSIGAFLRTFLLADKEKKSSKEDDSSQDSIELFFLNGSGEQNSKSIQCLEGLGVKVKRITNFHTFFQEYGAKNPPLMFDIDSFPVKESKNLIQAIRKYGGPSIFITQNVNLIQAFRIHLNPEKQIISLKPIDYCYFHWLLKHKWGKSE